MTWTDNNIYEIIIDGVARQVGPSITQLNIDRYKQQDLQRILLNSGVIGTDEEYIEAEQEMQILYKKIMGIKDDTNR